MAAKQQDEETNSPIITNEILKVVSDAKFTRTKRKEAPTHYTLEIESLPWLSKILPKPPHDRYESAQFEADGYQWRLILYPEGDKQSNGDGHISLYLKIEDIQHHKPEWEVDALLKFFVFIHTEKNQFECIQDGKLKRFNAVKKECGFSQLLPLSEFNDPSKGYLNKEGKCKFGVELFVIKSEGKGECFSIQDNPRKNLHSWRANLPESEAGGLFSDEFSLAGYKWKLHVYPEGVTKAKKQFVSIFLWLQDKQNFGSEGKMYVEFKIRIIHQSDEEKRKEKSGIAWFSASDSNWGFPYFLRQADLKELTYFDSVTIEAEISSISITTTDLSPDSPKV